MKLLIAYVACLAAFVYVCATFPHFVAWVYAVSGGLVFLALLTQYVRERMGWPVQRHWWRT